MTGVEILATEEVVTSYGFCWLAFWLMLILGGCATLCIGIAAWVKDGKNIGIPVICLMLPIVIVMSIFLGIAGNGKPTEYETHYEVTISEDVSMIEFLEKYEVIDQRGKIFVVKERNEVE